jgi:hypothetical protein
MKEWRTPTVVQCYDEVPWPKQLKPNTVHAFGGDDYIYTREGTKLSARLRARWVEVARRDGMIRYALAQPAPRYDAFEEPPQWDAQRQFLEQDMLSQYTEGCSTGEEALKAVACWIVDLLEMNHPPSRRLREIMAAEFRRLYWPDQGAPRKQRRREREAAQLVLWQMQIEHLAANKYRNERYPEAAAKREIAKTLGMSSASFRNKRRLYRNSLKDSAERLWKQRKRYPSGVHQ